MIETLEAIINTSPPSPVKVVYGRVIAIREPVIHVTLPFAPLGAMCEIFRPSNLRPIRALIVGFERDVATLAPFDSLEGIAPGSIVKIVSHTLSVKCGASLLGTMVDAFGAPLTPQKISPTTILPLNNNPPSPLEREPVTTQFHTGIRVIDTLFPIGFGQRVGIFAEPGAGKSTLLAMIAQQSAADVAVIALVGERGREVQEFVTESLGNSGRARSVVVACTSDEPPKRRAMAPFTATTIAEYFRAQGKNVLLLVDSLTRSARAIRDVGLAAGEMPIRQGYTPSVYT